MKKYSSFNNLFSNNRKALYIILSIMMISVLTLTIVYAALSTTLNISGNAEVSSASWDIYLDNVVLNSNSATTDVPTITDKTTASFSTTLSKPGDFYEFTIDVVNNGTIDAMIDSIIKMPELSVTQLKYLNYEIEYENGQAITVKQLVSKKSFVRLKVCIKFRKDLSASNLPTTSEQLNLSFKINYMQADDTGIIIKNDGVKSYQIVNGNLDTVGSEVAIGDERFYIISSDETSVTMLAKYNLYVGNYCTTSSDCTSYGEEATGLQDSTMLGYVSADSNRRGTLSFSTTNYWYNDGLKSEYGTSYPAYVYDSNSNIYNYIENYRTYLESQGAIIEEARLIKTAELESLGCISDDCTSAPKWVYSTSYWSGDAYNQSLIMRVIIDGGYDPVTYEYVGYFGIRPVITMAI